ncbi:zf-PARP-domain-containing protein [Schizopora paradoxa]|uniref:Zf-PARP-domain-containing protein n=1 Tax=Schizopora paradoxa TaxID=27342 RepID=A0A0H2RT69_9AGAM|nr:zf-PARP-domain-containing protein [Schizopora paradoxa]
MSDDEGGATKKSGYRLEYASSARAKCKGPKPCSGTAIAKGQLRLGTIVDFRGNTSFAWRHWGCTTSKQIANMKKSFENAADLDGYDELRQEDQEKIDKAWEDGEVADEDIPESARKPEKDGDDDEEKPKKKKAPAKKAKVRST